MKTVIAAYEAKTRLPELLRQARDTGAAIDRFLAHMRDNPVRSPRRINVRALIDDGRA